MDAFSRGLCLAKRCTSASVPRLLSKAGGTRREPTRVLSCREFLQPLFQSKKPCIFPRFFTFSLKSFYSILECLDNSSGKKHKIMLRIMLRIMSTYMNITFNWVDFMEKMHFFMHKYVLIRLTFEYIVAS